MDQQSEHTTIEINEDTVPHNGKPITEIAVSPRSKYVVTYSQEDKSIVGWNNNNNENSQSFIKDFVKRFINKDSQKNDSSNDSAGPLIVDNKIQPYKLLDLNILDFKVSDEKIIMYEDNNELGNLHLIFFLRVLYLGVFVDK